MSEAGYITVKSNLFALKAKLELATGKAYSWQDIAEGAGLNPNTVYSMARNQSNGIRYDTMQALLAFFKREGLDIGVADLFAVEVKQAA